MKTKVFILLVATIGLLSSCNSKRYEYDPYKVSDGKAKKEVSKTAFEIDFKKTETNLKTIHINLNGSNSYDAIFDTGCSMVLISQLECADLLKQGTLTESDETTPIKAGIADGSESYMRAYNLREVTIIDKNGKPHTLRDIVAAVAPNIEASILIGSSVIDNLAQKSYTVDLKKNVIRFE